MTLDPFFALVALYETCATLAALTILAHTLGRKGNA